jgi:predicted metalloprotease with PDZ domain
MKIKYLVEISNPANNMVKVTLNATRPSHLKKIQFFLPKWSPGSYLLREYGKNVRYVKVLNAGGEYLHFEQKANSLWEIDWENSDVKTQSEAFSIQYEVYCHELTVRTSHIDESHAFLHGPSYLMGILNHKIENPEIEFKFPPLWSKLHTGLKDISQSREVFLYTAANYDDLIDCPVEIGCHDSDGFMVAGKEHNLVFYGEQYPHPYNLKQDIKQIVETVASHFDEIPYDNFLFINHFSKGLYGGLEHKNSTALHFDGRKLKNRTDYTNWLALVAHEYFHLWNVKRIRPIELGPFDYLNENFTRMHWLTEGLTSFMDEIFVLRSGLITLKEYLDMQKKNLNRYWSIPGRKFHSLEDSSFNAWIKLYRPDENTNNSSVSYYLKGGLVFSTLHFELQKVGKSINDLLNSLWNRYKSNPEVGVTKAEVLDMIRSIGNAQIADQFDIRLTTTEEIDFESYYDQFGMDFLWEESDAPYLGVDFRYQDSRVFVDKVILDGPAYKNGLNAGDEIIAINRQRFAKEDADDLKSILRPDTNYAITISRLNMLYEVNLTVERKPRSLREIVIIDENKAKSVFC